VDAPYHFYADGATVDALPLEKLIGYAYVADHEGELGAADAERILRAAEASSPEAARRILIRGNAVLTEAGAKVFAGAGIALFGNESQTVGPENAPMQVHRIMLGAEVVLLEGIRLAQAEEGVWFLHAAPLNLGGADGAPCRATLLRE
jgi:arylformamidase